MRDVGFKHKAITKLQRNKDDLVSELMRLEPKDQAHIGFSQDTAESKNSKKVPFGGKAAHTNLMHYFFHFKSTVQTV